MAALRSLLRAHALDARRDGLLTSALLLLAAAPSAADARVLERGCAAILTAIVGAPRRSRACNAMCHALQPYASRLHPNAPKLHRSETAKVNTQAYWPAIHYSPQLQR